MNAGDPLAYSTLLRSAPSSQVGPTGLSQIILCLDNDEAGEAATLRAHEKSLVDMFGGWQAVNTNWVDMTDEYLDYLDDLLAVRSGLYSIDPKDKTANRDYYKWSTERKAEALAFYFTLVVKALFFGNTFNVRWVVPMAMKRAEEIIDDLVKRTTPPIKSNPAKTVHGWLTVEEILTSISPEKVFRHYLVGDIKKVSGKREFVSVCPFHDEKTPSFYANLDGDRGLWTCRGCKSGGDIFRFVMKMENISFIEAKDRLLEVGR